MPILGDNLIFLLDFDKYYYRIDKNKDIYMSKDNDIGHNQINIQPLQEIKKDTKNLFLWPRESFAPPSLFKHYIYLGEMAGIANKYSDTDIIDLSLQNITRQEFILKISGKDNIFIPTEVYTARTIVDFIQYIRNYTDAKIIGYSTAIALNSKIFEPYFDYLITSGFRGNIIKDMVINNFDNLTINNKIISHKKKPDSIEWGSPLFDKLPMNDYLRLSHGEVEISVQLGCKYNCGFCMEKIFHPQNFIEHRPIEAIVNFLNANIYEKYFFDATTFTLEKNWVLELSKAIKKYVKRPIKWRTVSRVDHIDNDIAKVMSEAGCYQIGLGIESLSLNVQKNMNKVIKENDILKTFSTLLRYGINSRGFFILGLPGQTKEDVDYCQRFIKENGIKCRWKEYLPLRKVSRFKDVSEFKAFEKDSFFFHPIQGLTKYEYLKVLLADNRHMEK
jgi:hypothetical protein